MAGLIDVLRGGALAMSMEDHIAEQKSGRRRRRNRGVEFNGHLPQLGVLCKYSP